MHQSSMGCEFRWMKGDDERWVRVGWAATYRAAIDEPLWVHGDKVKDGENRWKVVGRDGTG